MRSDMQRLRLATDRIVTKHEWMMSVLDLLERQEKEVLDEETPQMLY
jgi:hypothetical protein